MYTATCSFYTRRGNPIGKGQEIGRIAYFLLYPEDRAKFVKTKDISKVNIVKEENKRSYIPHPAPRQPKVPSNHHYGYGPEPGHSQEDIRHHGMSPSPYVTYDSHDDSPNPSYDYGHSYSHGHSTDSHSHSDYGSSHSDSGSHSSSDSSSCDSGGGDCGGGCDGGGGGGD